MNRKIQNHTTTYSLSTILLVFLCLEFLLNLTPPISRDALIHHLAVPKLWLRHGGIYEIPWADYSYYPMNINLLYLICLYFKNDVAPKFIHLTFGLGTGWLIYDYLRQKFDRNWGLLGMLIFISTPIVIWLSASAYIDLGMTFFTTASILAFVRWCDSEYKQLKWLLISSFCMGIAIGSKYNALIAWLIVNLLVMFAYARSTHRQLGAFKYGLIFFVITAAVALPWYLKNYLLTGNPFYPLFASFFKSLPHKPMGEIVYQQAAEQTHRLSFFKLREVVHGETFWETLLIPLRMFFQGDDNSYRYFQGVLNPVLIVFGPFILLNRRYARDKFLFVIFAVFFIIVSYFTTLQQVRYILPTLPFLAIIAVMGLKDLTDRLKSETLFCSLKSHNKIKSCARALLFAVVVMLLSMNGLYLKNRLNIIKPLPYVMGRETRDDFLKRHLLHYDAVNFINSHLPDDAVIYQFFLGRRGYYLDRSYKNEPSFGINTLKRLVDSSVSREKFQQCVASMGATHIMMRANLVDNHLYNNFSKEEIIRFMKLFEKYWKRIFEHNGHAVFDIKPAGGK